MVSLRAFANGKNERAGSLGSITGASGAEETGERVGINVRLSGSRPARKEMRWERRKEAEGINQADCRIEGK